MLTTILLSVLVHVILVLGITLVPPSWKLLRAVLLGLGCASIYQILFTPDAWSRERHHVLNSVAGVWSSFLKKSENSSQNVHG